MSWWFGSGSLACFESISVKTLKHKTERLHPPPEYLHSFFIPTLTFPLEEACSSLQSSMCVRQCVTWHSSMCVSEKTSGIRTSGAPKQVSPECLPSLRWGTTQIFTLRPYDNDDHKETQPSVAWNPDVFRTLPITLVEMEMCEDEKRSEGVQAERCERSCRRRDGKSYSCADPVFNKLLYRRAEREQQATSAARSVDFNDVLSTFCPLS